MTGIRATLADGTVTEQAHSTGTCFVIDGAGYALTNQHVVEGFRKQLRAELWREKVNKEQFVNIEPKLWVFFDDHPVSAEIVDTIEDFDVAVLKVARPVNTCLRLSLQNEIARGMKVAEPIVARDIKRQSISWLKRSWKRKSGSSSLICALKSTGPC